MSAWWTTQGWEWIIGGIPVLVVGASVGSFLNVVVYRLPQGLPLHHPPSHCPVCQTPLGWTENVPVLGWLWLRGRCRHCGTAIAWRYPAVEALMMGLYGWSWLVWGWSGETVLAVLLLSWLVPLALIDLDTFLLPEPLTRSGVVVGLLVRLFGPFFSGEGFSGATLEASWTAGLTGIGGMVLGILLLESIGWLGLVLLRKEAMGLGDGKLLALIGMWLGWQAVLVTLLVACLAGVVGSGLGLLNQSTRWGQRIPFGPYLALGGAVALFAGPALVTWYTGAWL